MNILLIDDDPVIRSLVEDILQSLGHRVVSAQDAAEGLLRFSQDQPQVVFLDYQLPDMTGLEVLRRLGAQSASCAAPVILLSASDDPQLAVRARQAGAYGCLEKPFRLDDFVRVLASLSS